MTLIEETSAQFTRRIREALVRVAPTLVSGTFRLAAENVDRAPREEREALSSLIGWTCVVFALPIHDQALWVWHRFEDRRFVFANYVLAEASKSLRSDLERSGIRCVDIVDVFGQRLSMTELGQLAGLGTRGLNNLLLHPVHGSWLQIHAIAVDADWCTPAAPLDAVCIQCLRCIDACPAKALHGWEDFRPEACSRLVASPWHAKSKAVALTANSYLECCECISACPIGTPPEGLFAWKR